MFILESIVRAYLWEFDDAYCAALYDCESSSNYSELAAVGA